MDDSYSKTVGGKCLRPVRNRRYSRKSIAVGQRPAKRLFTPEIKRYLKEWLIRHRENPYPNREDKKILAVDTGLTYIQICNWFANWRRKLKNAGNERHRKTWGHLIKTYNNHAQGNVEQFSICSDDSIWGEPDPVCPGTRAASPGDHCYSTAHNRPAPDFQKLGSFTKLEITETDNLYNAQCYQVSSTTEECKNDASNGPPNAKYKKHIMEKYLKGIRMDSQPLSVQEECSKQDSAPCQPVLLNKWRESAANFQPCESNYVAWVAGARRDKPRRRAPVKNPFFSRPEDCRGHGREEVEAAVTLTRLAGLHRS